MGADTATLIRRSARLDLSGIDFGAFKEQPLDAQALRCLRYMHDVEGHTMCYLRDVLVTRAHKDPEITAFLACWSYEEHWHGEAIAQVLEAHGEPAGPTRLQLMRRRLKRTDSLRPLFFSLGNVITRHLTAVHMTWGAINEWTTQAGYARLAAQAKHPVLAELLRRIMRQEGRHIDFYAAEARRRLESSPAARRMVRAALRRWWAPVGSGVMPATEVEFLATYLFADDSGMEVARRIDRQVERLPGLDGLHMVEGAVRSSLAAAELTARRGLERSRSGGKEWTAA